VSASGAPLLWNVPAAAVRDADNKRRLQLGAPAAATASAKLLFPPTGCAGAAPPADVTGEPLSTFGSFLVGGLPPSLLFFMASFPTAAVAPATGALCVAMQVYMPTVRPGSAALKDATSFTNWLITGSGSPSVDLGRLSAQCHRAVTAICTTLALASVSGPVSRMENSYELPPFDGYITSAQSFRNFRVFVQWSVLSQTLGFPLINSFKRACKFWSVENVPLFRYRGCIFARERTFILR
jgi:hypothetical protein